jgi:ABC-2 type transport system permease protein
MTTGAVAQTPRVVAAPPAGAGRALTRLAARQVRGGAALVVVVTAGMSALVAVTFQTTFAGALDGPALQALAANPAIRTLFGPPVALDDPGGFTVWRTGTPVAVLVGAWALLAGTRITRGEEEAGRWDLLLAGRSRTVDLVARSLGVLSGAIVLVGAGVAAALVGSGTEVAGSVLHAAGIAGVGLTFAALGVCAAQILPTRGAATGASVAVLVAALLARMIADGVDALDGLRWATPFGLVAEVRPYATDRPGPLLLLGLAPVVLAATTLVVARHRDIGAGLLATRSRRPARTRLLRSLAAFTVRRTLRPLAGWLLGVAAFFLLIGLLAESVSDFLAGNARFAELAAVAGFGGLRSVDGYAAAMFHLLAIPAGVYAAVRVAAAAAEETSRRAVLLLALPVSRTRLAGTEIAVAAGGVAVLLATAAGAVQAGTVGAGVPLGLGGALAGALNVAPLALLCLGVATLAWGWRPGAVAAIGSLPAAGGFLLQVLTQSTGAPAWVAALSPFAHVAAVPAVPPDWTAAAVMTGVAGVLALAGLAGYRRRDLAA